MSGARRDMLGAASTVFELGETLAEPPDAATLVRDGSEASTRVGRAAVGPKASTERAVRAAGQARYQSLGVLGEGGMGRVELVWDADLMRDLAVKRMHPELCARTPLMRQFLWEARVNAHLDHPNIVPVHDLGVSEDGQLYFTMKRVLGTPLDQLIERLRSGDVGLEGELSLPRRLRLFLQLCNAIAFAHSRGVLHRDLKPANVMLGEHGEVLLMDWGLAVPVPGADGERLKAVMPEGVVQNSAGTPEYMSPEQARSEPVDVRSDVYTLGVILYELCALERPYGGPTPQMILVHAVSGEHPTLEEKVRGISPSLSAVAEKAMSLDPAERYPSVLKLAEDVEAVLDGRTPLAEDASLVRRATRFYVSRDPAFGYLRVVDIDLWILASCLVGAAVGAYAARWLVPWWWALALSGIAVAIYPTVRWLRLRLRYSGGPSSD